MDIFEKLDYNTYIQQSVMTVLYKKRRAVKELDKRKKEVRIISVVALIVLVVVLICLAVSCQHKGETMPAETIEQDETTVPAEAEPITEPVKTEPAPQPTETKNADDAKPVSQNKAPENKPSAGANTGNTTSNKPSKPVNNKPATAPAKPTEPAKPAKPAEPQVTPNVPTTPPEVPVTPTEPAVTTPPATEPPAKCPPHNWTTVNHPEEGHKQGLCVCQCGQKFTDPDAWGDHIDAILDGETPEDAVLYHTSWYDDSEWIVDKPAWSETVCSDCGTKK